MSKRTDCHRPGAIVPTAYVCRLSYALPDPGWPGDVGYNVDHARKLCESIDWGQSKRGVQMFGNMGKCGICGARYRMGDIWEHDSGDLIHVGHECAAKYEMLADYAEFDAEMAARTQAKANVLEHARRLEARAAFLSQYAGLEEVLKTDHYISKDLDSKLTKYGSLSEKQIALAFKLAKEASTPKLAPTEGPKGEHKGTIGKRETFSLVLVRVVTFDRPGSYNQEDTGYVYIFQAVDGSDLVWFTSSPPCHKPAERDAGSGEIYGNPIPCEVKATVKKHEKRKDRPKTVLSRVVITWPKGLRQTWDEVLAARQKTG